MTGIGDLVAEAARRYGPATAIVHGEQHVSFSDFDSHTTMIANRLLHDGLVPGDRVAVLTDSGLAFALACYALAKAGLVRVALNWRETSAERDWKLTDSACSFLIVDDKYSRSTPNPTDRVSTEELLNSSRSGADNRSVLPNRKVTDLFRLAYTGGTTGRPKAAMLSEGTELAEVALLLMDLVGDIRPGDTMLHAAPLGHASGAFFLPCLMRGGRNVLLDRFEPEEYVKAAARFEATHSFLVPTMISRLLQASCDSKPLTKMRKLVYGAAPATRELLTEAEGLFGPCLAQTYGQTEAPMTISCLQPGEHHSHAGTSGHPYTLTQVRVVTEEDTDQPPGQPGEILVRGPQVMAGYWNQPDATDRALAGGWLHTGDIGFFDSEGYLSLVDRKNDLIITGGFNVYPREVELALQAHPQVLEAAVYSVPHPDWGEAIQATVYAPDLRDPQPLLDLLTSRIARYKHPKKIHYSRTPLPKTAVGKIDRREARRAAIIRSEQLPNN